MLSDELRLQHDRPPDWPPRMTKRSPFRYHKASPEIICLAVMLYICFTLSLRNVGDLLEKWDLTEFEKSLHLSEWQVSRSVEKFSSIGKGAVMNSTMRAVLVVSCLLLPTASFSQTQEMDLPIVYSSPKYKQAYTALEAGDYETAVRFYNLAGENGVPPAYFELGLMYLDGKGVPQDDAEAARLIELSARLNYPHAQAKLGVMYYNGQGVIQNTETAYMWLDVGFKNGSSVAGENREKVATVMNPTQITSAERRSDVCRASALKDCD